MIDGEILLRSLVGEPLATLHGSPNVVLSVDESVAHVSTTRSPKGSPVEISLLQRLLDRLGAGETVAIEPPTVGYRSAFLGAVLRTLPQIQFLDGTPVRARVDPQANVDASVLGELERRLRMWALVSADGVAAHQPPAALRSAGIYGGASGVWVDMQRTRGVAASGVAVALLHTGRHYPDDVSDRAVLYHYPDTARTPGRDQAEIRATKAAAELRLPVFVVLQERNLRTVLKAWVAAWHDAERIFLVEFGAPPPMVQPAGAIDEQPFELFEERRRTDRTVRSRPNQQRFKLEALQRYGGCQCAVCSVRARELITAAHLVPDADGGTSDPRNALLLCANHHLAFDRGLFWIDPKTTRIVVADGYERDDLNLLRSDLLHLRAQPARQALQYRWAQHRRGVGSAHPEGAR